MKRLLALLTLALQSCAGHPASAQEPIPFWARSNPAPIRDCWIHGRGLWQGPEHVEPRVTPLSSAVIEPSQRTAGAELVSYPLRMMPMEGANGQDGNRGLPYLQRFAIPNTAPAGDYILRFKQNDIPNKPGKTASVTLKVPPLDARSSYLLLNEVEWLNETLIVKAGTTHDGLGKIYSPSETFRGNNLVVMETGSTLRHCGVWCPEFAVPTVAIAVQSPSKNIRIEAVKVINQDIDEIGIQLRSAEDAYLHCVDICASRSIDGNPADTPRRNTFIRVACSGPRGTNDSQGGRSWGGEETLAAWCRFGPMDRGPTGSPQGSPLYRSVYWECDLRDTGVSEGASEGFLVECKKLCAGKAHLIGQGAVLTIDEGSFGAAKDFVKPGYFLFLDDGSQRWARILEVKDPFTTPGQAVRLKLDRVYPVIETRVYVGNGCVECSWLRCSFWNGKSGLWLWGANAGCAIVGNDFRNLDFGIGLLKRRNAPSDVGFSYGLIEDHNDLRNVAEKIRILQ